MGSNTFSNDPVEFVNFLKKRGLMNEKNQAICLDIATQSGDKNLISSYLQDLAPEIIMSQLSGSPFDIPDPSVCAPIGIAKTENGLVAGLFPDNVHILIAGQSGSGKSTLLKIIFSQALLFNKSDLALTGQMEKIVCWLFVMAHDMRSLLKYDPDILIVTFNEIKLNPLEPPPGMKPVEWASVFADFWIQAFRLYEGSKGFLIECLNALYKKNSSLGYYPSLFDLYYYVRALKFPLISRSARYQESILNRLGGLIFSSLSDVFNCSRGHINDLIRNHAIFEILYMPAESQIFMVNYLLSYLYHFKLLHETGLRHFVEKDDANLIFDKSYESRPDIGLPIIHHLLTTVRKNKITIFAATQTPHQLGASIHSNAFAKIMFSLSNGVDFEFMQRSMGIRDPEQKAYCYKLKPREAVIKFSARYQEPFIGIVPEVDL